MIGLGSPWLIVAGAALAFGAGWTVQGWRWSAADADRAEREIKARDAQAAKQHAEGVKYEESRSQSRVASQGRQAEIRVIYRDRVVDRLCSADPLSVGVLERAVRNANTAAAQPSGTVPSPSTSSGPTSRPGA